MIVKVYFYKEADVEIILHSSKLSQQALYTIYELVWEGEFKNILNPGRVWMKFRQGGHPFGIPLKYKRHHSKVTSGDIIQLSRDYYMVHTIGVKKITLTE